MAVYREQEFCPDCRQPYEGIYAHNDGTFVGDDFIGWDKDSHVCTPKENSAHSFTEGADVPEQQFKKVDSVTIGEIEKVLSKREGLRITQITIIKNEWMKEGNPVMMMHPNDYDEYEKTLKNNP